MTDPSPQAQAQNRALAEEIYDLLMGPIEPDLLLAVIPTLDATYAGETKEQHDARMKRYQAAYRAFDAELAKFMNTVNEQAGVAKKDSLKKKEAAARTEEQSALTSLESAFQ
jgi:hypothetical protein